VTDHPTLADFAVAGLSMYIKFPEGNYLNVPSALKGKGTPGIADIGTFVQAILPAVNQVKGMPGDMVDNAVSANVHYQVDQVLRSPLVRDRQRSGQLQVVGARYDLDTGIVTLVT